MKTNEKNKSAIVPIEEELKRIERVLSENEKRTNTRAVNKLAKLKYKVSALRSLLSPNKIKLGMV